MDFWKLQETFNSNQRLLWWQNDRNAPVLKAILRPITIILHEKNKSLKASGQKKELFWNMCVRVIFLSCKSENFLDETMSACQEEKELEKVESRKLIFEAFFSHTKWWKIHLKILFYAKDLSWSLLVVRQIWGGRSREKMCWTKNGFSQKFEVFIVISGTLNFQRERQKTRSRL